MLTNERGSVLELMNHWGQRDKEGQHIGHSKKNNNLEQQFDIIYVDEMPAELKKGDFNKQFGMHVMRPFFVVSALKSERYLDLIG
jgi:hypothetical protein